MISRWDAPQAQASTSRLDLSVSLKDETRSTKLTRPQFHVNPRAFVKMTKLYLISHTRKPRKWIVLYSPTTFVHTRHHDETLFYKEGKRVTNLGGVWRRGPRPRLRDVQMASRPSPQEVPSIVIRHHDIPHTTAAQGSVCARRNWV